MNKWEVCHILKTGLMTNFIREKPKLGSSILTSLTVSVTIPGESTTNNEDQLLGIMYFGKTSSKQRKQAYLNKVSHSSRATSSFLYYFDSSSRNARLGQLK